MNPSRRQVLVGAGATLLAGGSMVAVPSPAYADTGYGPTVYYKIKNIASGRLLSVLGGGTDNGADDILYDDVNATDQFWYIQDSAQGYKKFINVRSGRALSLDQGATANGTLVHLWQYLNGYPDQDWLVAPGTTSGTVTITSRKRADAALSTVSAGTANNTPVQVWDNVNASDQSWQIIPVQTFEDPTVLYQIVNKNSGSSLSVQGGGTADNSPAIVYTDVIAPDQYWTIQDIGGGYYHLVNNKSGRILSLTGGGTGNGTIAMIYDNVSASDQAWTITAQPNGYYKFYSQRRATGVLSVVGAGTANSTQAQIWDDISANDQYWTIVPVGNSIGVNAINNQAVNSTQMTGVGMEDVNHEIYGGLYSQMVFGESFAEPQSDAGISGMWRKVISGGASGSFALDTSNPFKGSQSQQVTFSGGSGSVGVDNMGLNRWGSNWEAGQSYDGYAYMRSTGSVTVQVAAESSAGTVYGSQSLTVQGTGWTKYSFSFTPDTTDHAGRFTIKLTGPGTVNIGYVYLQPGTWGRFAGLPVRLDIANAMRSQRNTVLRYGGSSADPGVFGPGMWTNYQWKNMVGPRESRPDYTGWWYEHESNGWGIPDFLNFAEALGINAVPTFNSYETPQDMADFVDYLKGSTSTTWGARRAADGHPAPYAFRQIEFGNEEKVDSTYATRFNNAANAIWAKDPSIIVTVADVEYTNVIADPDHVTGAGSGLGSLSAYQTILSNAVAHNAQIAIDLHIGDDAPERVHQSIDALRSFDHWLHEYNPGANYHINVFELNSGQHNMERALANAKAISLLQQYGDRVTVVASANALQPDGQNDNGWDQGLVFFDTHRSWLQPPGYVTAMFSESNLGTVVHAETNNPSLAVSAQFNGSKLVLNVTNESSTAQSPTIALTGFAPTSRTAQITSLSGARTDQNNAGNVNQVTPQNSTTAYTLVGNALNLTFAANSVTVVTLS
ncbi:RICIN domain-containing protein [Streptomyces sp. NPDC058469]|uniref:RICIN domain-containing protein n=1 Tax=Streptomyces sp. NPDC058469 TaxID=3346514 RepID=UPI003669DA92